MVLGRLRAYAVTFIGFHKIYRWGLAWDLANPPEDYFNLNKKDLARELKTPRPIRTIELIKALFSYNRNMRCKMKFIKELALKPLLKELTL